ncbi:MAG: NADH-quinone oxidoreductase subunit NuoK [Nitrospirota bacterium]
MVINLSHYLLVGAILFTIGTIGALTRRNAIIILLSIELMLNGVNLSFVAFSHFLNDITGQVFVLFVITIAAGEAAVGLGIIISMYRKGTTINVDKFNLLKG